MHVCVSTLVSASSALIIVVMLQEMCGLSSNLHLNHLDLSDNWYTLYIISMCNVHVFMGHGFTSGGQESGSAFSAALC